MCVSKSKRSGPENSNKPKDTSVRVPQREKLDWTLTLRERPDLTARQKEFRDIILDKHTKLVFINGPAGCSKTWLAVYCGLLLLQSKRHSHISYVRTVIESASKSLGALPGTESEKLLPYMMPLTDKLEEMLPSGEIKRLVNEERCKGIPVNFLRGASMNAQFIIGDEMQNATFKELLTIMTRLGRYSTMVLLGDSGQSDINGSSGWMGMFDLFNDDSSRAEGIHCLSFTREDIVRSEILGYILERTENYRANHPAKH